jgi:hypothetical protein
MARKKISVSNPAQPPSVEAGTATPHVHTAETAPLDLAPRPLTTAQALALAVLRGDTEAIGPLVDHLADTMQYSPKQMPPVRQVTCDRDRLRGIFYVSDPRAVVDTVGLTNAYHEWLLYGEPMVLTGIDRVELYELPEWATGLGSTDTGTGG